MPDLFDAVQVGANPTSDYTFTSYYPPFEPGMQDLSGADYDRAVADLARRVLNPPMGAPYEPPYEPVQDISVVQAPIMRLAPYRAPHYEPEQDISGVDYDRTLQTMDALPRFDNYPGMIQAPTMDLENTPPIRNEDGSISTVRSSATSFDDGSVLVYPTCYDGECHSDEEALQHALDTGINMGRFRVLDENGEPDVNAAIARAHDFSEDVHNYHDSKYSNGTMPDITGSDLLDAVRTAAGLSNPVDALLLYNYINGLRGE